MTCTIDTAICAECSSCLSNCPNRAVVKRGGAFFVTAFCSGCGNCVRNCPTGAAALNGPKVDFDHRRIAAALRERLGLGKDIVAMKYAERAPEGVETEPGPQFWCAICADVFEGQTRPLYFTARASVCGGSAMIGIGIRHVAREDFDEALTAAEVIGEGHLFLTKNEMGRARDYFPPFTKVHGGVVIGALQDVQRPDLILFPVNGKQMCAVSTAYTFETGQIMLGYGGSATCIMMLSTAVQKNEPSFSATDHGARSFMRLADGELVVCFPYTLVPGLLKNLDRTLYARERGA